MFEHINVLYTHTELESGAIWFMTAMICVTFILWAKTISDIIMYGFKLAVNWFLLASICSIMTLTFIVSGIGTYEEIYATIPSNELFADIMNDYDVIDQKGELYILKLKDGEY